MPIPAEKRDRAIYHTILAEMHRLHAILLNLQVVDTPDTTHALREHFGREQSVTLGKLAEWKQRRPELYREAEADFQQHV